MSQELRIVWIQDDIAERKLPVGTPSHIVDVFESRLGRSGRGRLWTAEGTIEQKNYELSNWPNNSLTRTLNEGWGGIVVWEEDVKWLNFPERWYDIFITDTSMNELDSSRPLYMLFRPHRGSLDESMANVRKIYGAETLKQIVVDWLIADDAEAVATKLICKPYNYDERIGWDTHILSIEGYGVIGFTDASVGTLLHAENEFEIYKRPTDETTEKANTPMRKTKRKPTSPAVMLREEFLDPLELSDDEAAAKLGISRDSFDAFMHGEPVLTADMALRLSMVTGTSHEFWLNLQAAYTIWAVDNATRPTNVTPLQ